MAHSRIARPRTGILRYLLDGPPGDVTGRRIARVLLAIPCILAALVLSLLIDPIVQAETLFLAGVVAAAWFGGAGAGLLGALLATLAFEFVFLLPSGTLIGGADGLARLVGFAFSALVVSAVSAGRRRTETALREMRDQLEARVRDRTTSLTQLNEKLQLEIAERHRSETFLAEGQRLSHTGSFGWHVATGTIYWSEETFRIFGCTHADVPTVGFILERTHPDDRERVRGVLELAARDGRDFELEHRLLTPDDAVRHVHVVAHALNDGAIEFVGAVMDVTDRKHADEALRESEVQWRAVFENNPTMYFMVDEAGTIMSVNPFGATQLGYTVTELVGRPVVDVFYEPDREAVLKHAATCLQQLGRTSSWELRKLRKDGTIVWVRETARAMLIRNRPVVLIVCEDITERKQAEEALRVSQAELAHVTRVTMLGEITASIAHEVNQPLAAVVMSGNACRRWLDADPPDLAEARNAVQRIISDGNRASEVVRRVRSLLQSHVLPQRERLDVNDLIQEALALTRSELAHHHVSVSAPLAESLPFIEGDRVGLQQVLVNLILNGVDAMSVIAESSRVLTIRTRAEEACEVLVEVQDCGRGLDGEQCTAIFEPFVSTKPGGLGMGLSISRTIVQAHGGRLWATPNDLAGATLHFSLPSVAGADH